MIKGKEKSIVVTHFEFTYRIFGRSSSAEVPLLIKIRNIIHVLFKTIFQSCKKNL